MRENRQSRSEKSYGVLRYTKKDEKNLGQAQRARRGWQIQKPAGLSESERGKEKQQNKKMNGAHEKGRGRTYARGLFSRPP